MNPFSPRLSNRQIGALILLLASLMAYMLPWSSTVVTSLNLGAYDLAEWLSLHPATQPLRIPSLLLRLQPLLITWLFTLHYPSRGGWSRHLWLVVIVLLCVAQLPPLDFINRLGDQNQQQQLALALSTFIGAIGCTWLSNRPQKAYFGLLLAFLGVITSVYATLQAQALMQQYAHAVGIGLGMPFMVATYGVWGIRSFVERRTTNGITEK